MPGRGDSVSARVRTPRGELARLRELQQAQRSQLAERIMEAMLEACGEHGYRNVSVQQVIDRYGGNRYQFYAHFADKAECYAAAYEFEVERRYAMLLEATRGEPTWAQSLVTALRLMAALLEKRSALARGLLVEVHVAGGRALRKRSEMLERLAADMDRARRERRAGEPLPPMTASFLLGAIESFITGVLLREAPHEFAAGLRELAEMVLSAYFGEETALEQLDQVLAAA